MLQVLDSFWELEKVRVSGFVCTHGIWMSRNAHRSKARGKEIKIDVIGNYN